MIIFLHEFRANSFILLFVHSIQPSPLSTRNKISRNKISSIILIEREKEKESRWEISIVVALSLSLSLVPGERLIMYELLTFARLDVASPLPSPPLPPPRASASDPTRRHKTRESLPQPCVFSLRL